MTVPATDVARMIAGRAKLGELAALFSAGAETPPPLSPRVRRALRERVFAERPLDVVRRVYRAARAALARDGFGGCFRAAELALREKSIGALGLPDPSRAMTSPEGLCGIADDLSVATIMDAYERGLYPSGHLGPMKWWSPASRAMIAPERLAERLSYAHGQARVAFDQDFEAALCEADAEQPTPPRLKWAFARLFDAGFAHSFDISQKSGERIAGGYGVAVGRVFVIESVQFTSEEAHAPALAALAAALEGRGFAWIDAKRLTPQLAADGFDGAPRIAYLAKLRSALGVEHVGAWTAPDYRRAA